MRKLLLLAFITAFALTGCVSMQRSARRTEILHSWTEKKVYDAPLDTHWPRVRQYFFTQGYTSRTGDEQAGYNLETDWQVDEYERNRLLIQGIPANDNKGCRFVITRMTETRDTQGQKQQEFSARDLELEWLLWQHLNPEDAQFHHDKAQEHATQEITDG